MEFRIPAERSQTILSFLEWTKNEAPFATAELSGVIGKAKHGLTVEVRPLELHHTDSQRGYYWKWTKQFADYCGMTPDEMHEEMLCTAYGSEEVPTKFGVRRRPLQRSSTAKRGDYSQLIDTLIRVAAEMGFDVPPPQ